MSSRWQASKIGLINFWYYDEQEFPFVKGRMLLRGSNGSGKSTLCNALVGLIPHYFVGKMSGSVTIDGSVVEDSTIADLSTKIGLVFQNPFNQLSYTAGTVAEIPSSIMSSGRTLAIHMYSLSKEGLYTDQAYATAVVLLIVVVLINMLSNFVAKKFTKK